MKYRESQTDKDLRQWFMNDYSKHLLRSISVLQGNLRGVSNFSIAFDYPISAIAGTNGSGKSTILALAACAYHATENGFRLPRRKTPYFTFSDFFIQHKEEIPLGGLQIRYVFATNVLKKSETNPSGIGLGSQLRKKNKGGKWNDYDRRLHKCVIFLGIERIVPHVERSQSRSYSRSFIDSKPKGWESKVKEIVGEILGRKYDDFRYLEYSRYSLPLVKVGEVTYSGFNMGAGENALFEIFSVIYSCGQPALLVIDEIELGLHAKAQNLFMKKLKEVCKETGTQVICTTHSKQIFECLPSDARFFIEAREKSTKVINGISPQFAFSKLAHRNEKELDVYVEDGIAKLLVEAALPASLRTRINIQAVGSANAVARQLAAHYARRDERAVVAIFDGDHRGRHGNLLDHAKKMAENVRSDFAEWFSRCTNYLPGDAWPECWVVQSCKEDLTKAAAALGLSDAQECGPILEYGLQAGKHDEFYEISKHVGLDKDQCALRLASTACAIYPQDCKNLSDFIKNQLD